LILTGRVSCLIGEACFKTYLKGSFFGDVEIFKKCSRLFGVKAQQKCTLLIINGERLRSVLDRYPSYFRLMLERAIRRYFSLIHSMVKFEPFQGIKAKDNDGFWDDPPNNDSDDFYTSIQRWLETVHQKNLNETIVNENM
jgi:hypothetical protein